MTSNERRELGIRGLRLRAETDGDGRTIEGLAVPFGDVIDTFWDGKETFDRDCVFDGADDAKLCYQHGELIGRITATEQRDDGLHIRARIADTQLGRDVMGLLDEGALDSLSIGFVPIESTRDENDVTHRRHVRLLETSLVSWPAYEAAKLTAHRNAGHPAKEERNTTMPTPEELAARCDELEDMQRTLAASMATRDAGTPILGAQYRSFGDLIKALGSGDDTAASTYRALMDRAYDGTTFADTATQTTWVADRIRLVQSRRSIIDLFASEPLPETGETFGYKVLKTNTVKIDEQAGEGDELSYGKVTLGTKTATLKTYGGYSKMSFQSIQRSDTSTINTTEKALLIAYANRTEAAARKYLYDEIAAQKTAGNKLEVPKALTSMTANEWIDVISDAGDKLDERGSVIGTLGVSSDVWKAIAKLTRDGDALMNVSGQGPKELGTIDIKGTSGTALSVTVRKLIGAPDGTAAFLDPEAVIKWEDGAAPFRLQDSNVITLTEEISLYGYLAFGTPFPDGILPLAPKA